MATSPVIPLECYIRALRYLGPIEGLGGWSVNKACKTEEKRAYFAMLFAEMQTQPWVPERKMRAIALARQSNESDPVEPYRLAIVELMRDCMLESMAAYQPTNYRFYKDLELLRRIILCSNKTQARFYGEAYSQVWCETYLNLMSKEHMGSPELYLELYKPWDETTLRIVSDVISFNSSITKVFLFFKNWTASQLTTVVQSMYKNSSIQEARLLNSRPSEPEETQREFAEEIVEEIRKTAEPTFRLKIGAWGKFKSIDLFRKT
jgi:hypothetical protein